MIYALVLLFACLWCAFILTGRRRRKANQPILAKRGPLTAQAPWPESQADADESEDAPLINPGSYAVLIADDQTMIRSLLREWFERDGIRVIEAANGRSAVEAVLKHRIDYVLLDLQMPDMNGIEALHAIRGLNARMPVAIMTGTGDADKLADAERLGVCTFFVKPFDIDLVKKQVIRSLKNANCRKGEVS